MAREYTPKSSSKGPKKERQSEGLDATSLRWKTGVLIKLLDAILEDALWADGDGDGDGEHEQLQLIRNLYDYLILCIAIDNREVRQRVSKLFGGVIRRMVFDVKEQTQTQSQSQERQSDSDDHNGNGKLHIDSSRVVSI